MNKFEEFTTRDGELILINTDTIFSVYEVITDRTNTVINTTHARYPVKETYIEVFERLQ
jgi:hypothetical protein